MLAHQKQTENVFNGNEMRETEIEVLFSLADPKFGKGAGHGECSIHVIWYRFNHWEDNGKIWERFGLSVVQLSCVCTHCPLRAFKTDKHHSHPVRRRWRC